MAVVRIEVDFDVPLEGGVESAGTARIELDDPSPDLGKLLDRAHRAMLRVLPQKTAPAPPAGETILTLNNVRFSEVDQNVLFGAVQSAGTSRVDVTFPPTQQKGQCQDYCPTDEAGHPPCRCELPLGHPGKHRAYSSGHGWPEPCPSDDGSGRRCELGADRHKSGNWSWPGGAEPLQTCGHLMRFGDCDRVKGHPGPHSDAGQCPAHCPEPHRPYRRGRCGLRDGHDGSHEATSGGCMWANPDQERHDSGDERVGDAEEPCEAPHSATFGDAHCGLPLGHAGPCGQPEPEVVDCA